MSSRKRSIDADDDSNEGDRPSTPEDGVIEMIPPPLPPPPFGRANDGMVTPLRPKVPTNETTIPTSRDLFPTHDDTVVPTTITPPRKDNDTSPPAKRRLIFGKPVVEVHILPSVKRIYQIVKKRTGAIGGNASAGPIYGELTMGSMQKMINLMKEHTGFDETSRFIDVGSGVGKPNLHVAQDPGVAFSYGIEVEHERWLLSMHGLDGTLQAMDEQQETVAEDQEIKCRCMFVLGDIRSANTFDPFTHVYMFSIGFPPKLWCSLAEMWNRSESPYMTCFHSPKDIIDCYEFNVELVVQTPTSMHGSKEGHTGYIYRRKGIERNDKVPATVPCDPLFAPTRDLVNRGFDVLKANVQDQLTEIMKSGVSTRSKRR